MMPPQAPKRVTTAVVKDKGAVVGYGLWWRAWRRAWKVRMRGEHRVVADGGMCMHVHACARCGSNGGGLQWGDKWVYRGRMCKNIPVQCCLLYNSHL